ncbi:MAG: diaminopimelate epimerase [Candidatus Omnitrophica bacterium]|nr:diaminopimelate epimerase [Candidatus Omnitrophota bacterium]MDD5610471.1 diaminopimelate epimerase [Candidatus Omnitrophota bacterium]
MKKINFTKMVAAGNDFIVIKSGSGSIPELARKMCARVYGAGADGLLLIERSKKADIRMRIFNSDGTEAEMCGNGARCAALYSGKRSADIETKAGIIRSRVDGNNVKINLTTPKDIKLDIPIKVEGRRLKVNFLDTGVPHCVIFVEGLDIIDMVAIGRRVRYHKQFAPRGTNVDFVEILSNDSISIRTYERGVEDETLACGTGSVASAVVSAIKLKKEGNVKINVLTAGKEVLKVYLKRQAGRVDDVWLEGKVKKVYEGVYNV